MAEIVLEPEAIEIPEPDLSNLITEGDTPVGNIFSEKQQRLLTESLYTSWGGASGEESSFVALANVGFFYRVESPAVVPGVLLSLGVSLPDELWEKKHRSYFLWEYGKPPEVVIEVVSNRKGEELGKKLRLYAQLGVVYYVVFDPGQQLGKKKLRVFVRSYMGYEEIESGWLPGVELGLVLWQGSYEGQEETWLRWRREDGTLIQTGAEALEQERQRTEKLATQLRALGIEPDL